MDINYKQSKQKTGRVSSSYKVHRSRGARHLEKQISTQPDFYNLIILWFLIHADADGQTLADPI